MEMRKFIIEIHPDGSLTCCEYEDPKDAAKAAYNRAWAEGYRQALIHCEYQGAVKVREHMRNFYQKLYNKYI